MKAVMLRNKEYGEITPPPPIPFYFFLPNPPHSPPTSYPYLSLCISPLLQTQNYPPKYIMITTPPPPPLHIHIPLHPKKVKGGVS